MPGIEVVLVNPRTEGNVGAVARVMANFGMGSLTMVDPCELSDEAYRRAKHAGDILRDATIEDSLDTVLERYSLVVGTSGIVSPGEKHFIRIPITPRELVSKVEDFEGDIALLFGRENLGLYQEELRKCDLLVHIPTHEDYRVLNLSHAVAVVLYELFVRKTAVSSPTETTALEREKLYEFFSDLLEAIDYPDFRKEKTAVMFRRMMGRAVPTKWEFHTIMGVISEAARRIKEKKS